MYSLVNIPVSGVHCFYDSFYCSFCYCGSCFCCWNDNVTTVILVLASVIIILFPVFLMIFLIIQVLWFMICFILIVVFIVIVMFLFIFITGFLWRGFSVEASSKSSFSNCSNSRNAFSSNSSSGRVVATGAFEKCPFCQIAVH